MTENHEIKPEKKKDFIEFIGQWNGLQKLETPRIHIKIAEWLERSWNAGHVRLLLMAFRSSGKSTLVGLFAAWLLYIRPQFRILVLAADFNLAKRMVRNVKRIIELHPLTAGMKPQKADQWASDRFTVNRPYELRDPSMLARGIGSNITGSRADLVICDDVEVPDTSDTEEKRANLRERLLEISFVLVPGGTQLYVGTPHTYFTIYETAPRGDEFEDRAFLEGFRLLEIPVYDEGGESAWPERFSAENIEQIKTQSGPNKFASQMLLKPVNAAEGRLDPALINVYEEQPEYSPELKTLFLGRAVLAGASAFWDPAFGSARGDSSVLACVFTDEDGNYYVQHVEYIRIKARAEEDEATAQCRIVVDIARCLRLPSVTVESNGIGVFLPNMLRNEMGCAHVPCAVKDQHSRIGKEIRILEAFDALLAARRIYVHRSVTRTPFLREMQEWVPVKNAGRDDGLDAVAGALLQQPDRLPRIRGISGHGWTRRGKSFEAKTEFRP